MTETTRRTVMFGAGGAGLAVVLSACSGYSTGGDTAAAPTAESPRPAGEATETSGGGGDDAAANALAKTSDIPEGEGKIFESEKVVVTQPQAGTFKAFSAVCTHQGCTVGSVSGGTINCPCHGSKFSITDGSVQDGPAKQPLEEKQLKVSGDSISLA